MLFGTSWSGTIEAGNKRGAQFSAGQSLVPKLLVGSCAELGFDGYLRTRSAEIGSTAGRSLESRQYVSGLSCRLAMN